MAATPEGADYRLSIFNRQGWKTAEIDATFHCIWTMAPTIGTAYYTMSTSDPKCTFENCAPGRYVLFEHNDLGNWGGVICTHNQRRWNGEKQITIPIMAAEYQFNRRRAGAGSGFDGNTGTIFKEFCRTANSAEDALIRFNGAIWGGGGQAGVADPKNAMLSDIMAQLANDAGVDWWFDPVINPLNGRLNFNACLSPKRGRSNNYVLKEGFNLENISGDFFVEEGDIVNDNFVTGVAARNGDTPKKQSIYTPSINQYGLWQNSESSTSSDEGPVQAQADATVNAKNQPVGKFMLTALKSVECPDTFQHLRTGDTYNLDINTVSFYNNGNQNGIDARTRVLSREYSTDEDKVVLVGQNIVIPVIV